MKDETILIHMGEKEILKCVLYNRNSDAYIKNMVASWAWEVTLILTQKSQWFFVWGFQWPHNPN